MMSIEQAITKLATSDLATQTAAAEWCAQHAEEAGPAAVLLLGHLTSDDESLRNWCSEALESLGPPPAEQLPPLAEQVHNTSDDVAYWAITLLGRGGASAEPFVSLLEAIADGPRSDVLKKRAAWAVERIKA